MATVKLMTVLPLVFASLAVLWANSSSLVAKKQAQWVAPESTCEASLTSWLGKEEWPQEEILVGENILTRKQLRDLVQNNQSPVANLARALATAQLNLAAGAQPSTVELNAIFDADRWLLPINTMEPITTTSQLELGNTSLQLNQFNTRADNSTFCVF